MDTELYKYRSLGGCLKAAFDLYRTNLKTIFRRTWLPALLLSIIGGAIFLLTAVMMINNIYATPAAPQPSVMVAPILGAIALCILFIAAYTWFYTIIISLLNGESVKHNLPRIVRLMLLALGIVLVIVVIAFLINFIPLLSAKSPAEAMQASTISTIITSALFILIAVVAIPLSYSTMKYCMESNQKLLSIFKKSYLCGWRHWGYLFLLALLCYIIMAIINLVVNMPATITIISLNLDTFGILLGDPSGLPGYFDLLTFFASLIANFITIYVVAWFACVIYYAYGHIEAKEKAKKEALPQAEDSTSVEQNNNYTTNEPDFEEVR